MALMVWLPLNGSVENKGACVDTFTTSGVSFANGGKIGEKYFSGGTITIPAAASKKIFNKNAMSFAFWLYPIGTSNSSTIMGKNAMSTGDNRMYTIFQYSVPTSLHLSWQDNTATNNATFLSTVQTNFFTADTWTHCCITYDGSKVIIYKNGVQNTTINCTSNRTSFEYDYPIYGSAIRKLNDLRIYNHCLSPAEVHEISQGLVLHYKLDDTQLSPPNLLQNSGPHLNATTGWTARSGSTLTIVENSFGPFGYVMHSSYGSSSVGVHHQPYSINDLVNGETYTFSGWIRASTPCTVKWYNEWFTTQPYIDITTEWQFIYSTGIIDTSRTYHSDICYPVTSTSDLWIETCMWKLEKGSKPTKWVPHTTDTIYNGFMGDMTKIQDSSGYNHNGTIIGTPTLSSNTARYSSSMQFNGSNQAINTYREAMVTDAITASCWAYMPTWTASSKTLMSCVESQGWGLKPTGNSLRFVIVVNNSSNTTLNATSSKTYASLSAGWHMFTGTCDGTVAKFYIDGELEATSSTITKGVIQYNSGNSLFIGAEASGSASTPASDYFAGNISDARIYATALSQADIKQLYNTAAKVDNLGSIHTFEFQEKNNPKIYKTGITEHKEMREAYMINTTYSYSYKPAANTNNSTTSGITVDFSAFTNETSPLSMTVDYDASWTNFASGTGGTFSIYIQGNNRRVSDNAWAWEGSNYLTNNGSFTTLITANANGSTHVHYDTTIPVSWLSKYNASHMGMRTNYSDGNGTITISNIKITLTQNSCKIKNNYLQANTLIEK